MRRSIVLPFALFALLAGGGRAVAQETVTAVSLLPKDPLAVVRFASLGAVESAARRVAGAFSEADAGSIDIGMQLAGILRVDPKILDRTLPCWIGVAAGAGGSEPHIVVILPVTSADGITQNEGGEGQPAIKVAGKHLAISINGPYEAGGDASKLLTALPEREIVARADMTKVMAAYGEQISEGLDAISGMLDQAVPDPAAAQMAGTVIEGLRGFLQGSERWELAAGLTKDQNVELEGAVTFKPGAGGDLLGLFGKADLASLARRLPGDQGIGFAMAMSPKGWSGFLRMMEPLYASIPGGKDMYAQIAKAMDVATKHLKGGMAGSAEIKLGGISVTAVCESDDPKAYIAAVKELQKSIDLKSLGISFGPPIEGQEEGVQEEGVIVHRMTLNYSPPSEGPGAMPAEQRAMVEKLFGKGSFTINLVPLDKLVLMTMGNVDFPAAIAAAKQSRQGTDRLVAAIEGSKDAAMVMKMDLRALLAVAAMSPETHLQVPAGAPVELVMSLGAKDRMVSGRMRLDYQALASLVKSMMK